MKTNLYVGLILLFGIISCNEDDNGTPDDLAETPCYFPLSVGSYWIYNSYEIDSQKNEILIGENDTTFITGDTAINGNTYFVFYGKRWVVGTMKMEKYYRDSSGFIVNPTGEIVFAVTDRTDTLFRDNPVDGDSSLCKYGIIEIYPGEISVPAGVFDSLYNYRLNITFLDTPGEDVGNLYNFFAPNIGRITRQNFYMHEFMEEGIYYEERLVDYYIAPERP
jgi:hypothetical protein